MHVLSLFVGAVKVVDHHPPRLLLICLFPPVPRDHDSVAITLVNPPPQGITVVSPAPGSELIHHLLTVFKHSLNVLIVLDWRDAVELLTFIF